MIGALILNRKAIAVAGIAFFLLTAGILILWFGGESLDHGALARRFVELLSEGDFSRATENFDSTMKEALTPELLEQSWEMMVTQKGPFKRQTEVRTEKWGQYDVVFVTCEFENSTLNIQVVFNSSKQIAGLWFLPSESPEYEQPAYARFDSFEEEEVMVGTGEWRLPGTLTIPKGDGPFPAVVLVHGSGALDRNETIGPNKPFCDLAWGLASRGIAVLRYEKRTREHSEKIVSMKEDITVWEETIEDAFAGVSLMRVKERIDAERVYVIGHSLGGTLIPRIGIHDSEIAGFIIMAGATKPLEDKILEQTYYIYSLDGNISETERTHLQQIEEQVAMVKSQNLSTTTPSEDLPLGLPAKYWLDLRDYRPHEAAKNLTQPLLILQGERDYQVTMEDLQGWNSSLYSHDNVEFIVYPSLNHLFMEGEGKSTPNEYYAQAGNIAEKVIIDIANWIENQSA